MRKFKATNLAYVRVKANDHDTARRFFLDFGLMDAGCVDGELSFRAIGPAREILSVELGGTGLASIGFEAGQRDDLDHFASAANGTVSERKKPGGGWQACANDPDGNRVELVWGISPVDPVPIDLASMNDATDRQRRQGTLVRPPSGPSRILRLGHVVLTTPQPLQLAEWYREMFGLLVSDEIYAEHEENVLLSFNRLDRGEEFVDHHVFQTLAGPARGVHHISFEVLNLDDLQIGNAYLVERGYRHMWGIGRHKQGSQIFDYWLDPFGMMYEHWTDTDLLNASSSRGKESVETSSGPWGPPVPAEFLTHSR